jgi:phosphoribosylformylglycinamidine cyclo-ligase
LIGGETAEMPDMYKKGDYDLAGFSVGLIDRENIIDGSDIKIGDIVIGLQSSGLHSNGYSLVRKLLFKDNDFTVDTFVEDLSETIGAVTLRPTRIYVKSILSLIKNHIVHAIVHNTGGGLSDNIARVLPEDCCAVINKSNWEPHAIFSFLQDLGNISENDMFKTFNMGIGMVIVVPKSHVDDIVYFLDAMGEICYIMGEIIKNNDESVIFTK